MEPVLLECNLWGVAGGILSATLHRGCHPGQEHPGGPTAPMREVRSQLVLLLGRPVDSRLGYEPESVFATSAQKSTPQPQQSRRV